MPNRPPPLILIAADDLAVGDALQFALRLEGYSVHIHREGAGLLADPALAQAACMILDDRKPHLDAFELLAQLRESAAPAPVILLTGHATKGLRARAATAGVRSVLEKPLLDDVLLDSLRSLVDHADG
jgi:two-component system response regulator FixJ